APDSVVLSGRREPLQSILETLERESIRWEMLNVSHAFHSPLIEPILPAFENVAGSVRYRTPHIKFVSNVSGCRVDAAPDATQWKRHAVEPVQFQAGIETLRSMNCRIFVEIGPGAALMGLGRRSLPAEEGVWLPSIRKGRDEWQQLLETLARLYVAGVDVDW